MDSKTQRSESNSTKPIEIEIEQSEKSDQNDNGKLTEWIVKTARQFPSVNIIPVIVPVWPFQTPLSRPGYPFTQFNVLYPPY